ncbi:GNAT family N-acetyltransferase [Streptomyces beihaiensis]|uniref:GNAT family N-acetyltransferase n=1 Tax=Streptomyces beihaiensis TaxID=2984495 RepID=A0ABT3TQ95_9ACTN|nr:GNAT family N-acetyltransferase [Streptomyces beihaiensis]MCX3059212.1 GNAT family N-acetyltransferase [Streptomyces beihaiensis]
MFEARAGAFMRRDPALHSVGLGVVESLRAGDVRGDGDVRFGVWVGSDGRTGGYFFWTPPRHPYVSLPDAAAARALVEVLADRPVRGVTGAAEAVAVVADAWRGRHPDRRAECVMRQRLYRLSGLTPPDPLPPGRPRVADEGDRELLERWFLEFSVDAGLLHEASPEQAAQWVDGRLAFRGVTLWEAEDGTPVSMAGVTRPAAGAVRVAPVYTPPALRGRGYAGAVTAEISRAARQAGAREVLLNTDLANPTSNALYQRIGYRPVRDFAVWEFTATEVP